MTPVVWPDEVGSLGLGSLQSRYRSGLLTPGDVVSAVYDRIEAAGDDHVWISVVPRHEAEATVADLEREGRTDLPLWGVPFAVKDNIDVAGLPTTAACPDFSYSPSTTATAVRLLLEAGAILIGKTNLDQFATGLNGTRSPYGIPANVYDADYISGGSSSGSAVAVAKGLVAFSLGTDTAGSGRVPAALNGIVGVKPSIGLVSTAGVLPACRSLDCTSVFALDMADAAVVLAVIGVADHGDSPARVLPVPARTVRPTTLAELRLGVPDRIAHWGDLGEESAWARTCGTLAEQGVELVPMDMTDFIAAGSQLYGGAWLAERLDGLEPFISDEAESVLPVIRTVLAPGAQMRATDVFDSLHRMAGWKLSTHRALAEVDALLTPTVTATSTIEQMLADPVELNSRLGRFTTFTNLLDLCAVSVPVGVLDNGMPFGVSIQAVFGRDGEVAGIGASIERHLAGAGGHGRDAGESVRMDIAVVGAHLAGQPLNHELLSYGARFVCATTTAESYRLFALDGTHPMKPGLRRVSGGGSCIEVEIYDLPVSQVGAFLATIPAPLGLGRVELVDGRSVQGFICEPVGLDGAQDISDHGGWRAYLTSLSTPAEGAAC